VALDADVLPMSVASESADGVAADASCRDGRGRIGIWSKEFGLEGDCSLTGLAGTIGAFRIASVWVDFLVSRGGRAVFTDEVLL